MLKEAADNNNNPSFFLNQPFDMVSEFEIEVLWIKFLIIWFAFVYCGFELKFFF